MLSATKTKFRPLLLFGLVAPLVVATLAWFVQLFEKFPPRSPGASLTAVTFALVPLIEILAAPAAVAVLVRRPESRTAAVLGRNRRLLP
jgi:multisubunit Na+/H+ antiporter MnhE subunit